MHWAEVRVGQAFTDVHGEPCRRSASARRNHRTLSGDIKVERASARQAARVRIACMNEHTGRTAGMAPGRVRHLAGRDKASYFALLTIGSDH